MNSSKSRTTRELKNVSSDIGLIAVQGPAAQSVLQKMTSFNLEEIKRHKFESKVEIDGRNNTMISRTGYTGEDGFELYLPAAETEQVWQLLLECQWSNFER